MAGRRRTLPYKTREQLAEAMHAAVLAKPSARTQDGMAQALDISVRSLYRLRAKFNVPWPPFDDWAQLVRRAGAIEPGESQASEQISWLVTYTVREQRWITAASIEEAIEVARAEIGPRAVILSINPA